MKLIKLDRHNQLPKNINMVEFGKPYYAGTAEIDCVVREFKAHYGYAPKTVYLVADMTWNRVVNKYFVELEE